ncbi:MAG: hypothetical protein D6759_11970, partial [Chloroflexi bacterium]
MAIKRARKIQTIVALLSFLLPLLLLPYLFRIRDTSWRTSGLSGVPVVDLVAGQAQDQVIFYAASVGGIYRNASGELVWEPANTGLPLNPLRGLTVSAMAVDPQDPLHAYLAVSLGQGESALYQTTDGGESWSRLPWTPGEGITQAIAIFPGDGRVLYILHERRVFRSDDAGRSWRFVSFIPEGVEARHLLVSHQNADLLYLASANAGVLRSTDGGSSWQIINEGLKDHRIVQIAISPLTPQRLYVVTRQEVYRSDDGGVSWISIGRPSETAELTAIALDPERPGIVYLGTSDGRVLVTTNAGRSWVDMGGTPNQEPIYAIALAPRAQASVHVATADGIWRYTLSLPPEATPAPPAIVAAPTATATATATMTPRPTATQTRRSTPAPSATPSPSPTATPTPTPTPLPPPPP